MNVFTRGVSLPKEQLITFSHDPDYDPDPLNFQNDPD